MSAPSEWAMKLARIALGIGGHTPDCECATCALDQRDVATALDAARAEGFKAGAEAMQTAAVLVCAHHTSANWAAAAIIRIDAATITPAEPA